MPPGARRDARAESRWRAVGRCLRLVVTAFGLEDRGGRSRRRAIVRLRADAPFGTLSMHRFHVEPMFRRARRSAKFIDASRRAAPPVGRVTTTTTLPSPRLRCGRSCCRVACPCSGRLPASRRHRPRGGVGVSRPRRGDRRRDVRERPRVSTARLTCGRGLRTAACGSVVVLVLHGRANGGRATAPGLGVALNRRRCRATDGGHKAIARSLLGRPSRCDVNWCQPPSQA